MSDTLFFGHTLLVPRGLPTVAFTALEKENLVRLTFSKADHGTKSGGSRRCQLPFQIRKKKRTLGSKPATFFQVATLVIETDRYRAEA